MNKHLLNRRWLLAVLPVFLALSMVLSACNQDSGSGSSTGTTKQPVATAASIQLGSQPCPAAVPSAVHWETIVGTSATQNVEGVLCGYLMGVPALQAVVKVRYGGTNSLLDIDVYANITGTNPSRIFRLKGLPHGDVAISNYNTLLTGEIDPQSSQQAGIPSTQVQQDLYREFRWSYSAGTLVQIAFPGLYPDLTRYQAEFEQGEVNTGQGLQQWRLSAVTTAQNFAEFVLGWDPNAPTTVVSGGGTHDAKALILVKNPSAGSATIKLSLSRLELNTNGGIWEVTNVATDGMTISSPQNAQQLTSPMQVTEVDTAFAGKPTTIMVFDHDRSEIGQATVSQASGIGKTHIATSISYSSSFQGETQEGIIALYAYTGNHVIAGVVMVKVLLSA
jgi:predicted small secreted protein